MAIRVSNDFVFPHKCNHIHLDASSELIIFDIDLQYACVVAIDDHTCNIRCMHDMSYKFTYSFMDEHIQPFSNINKECRCIYTEICEYHVPDFFNFNLNDKRKKSTDMIMTIGQWKIFNNGGHEIETLRLFVGIATINTHGIPLDDPQKNVDNISKLQMMNTVMCCVDGNLYHTRMRMLVKSSVSVS